MERCYFIDKETFEIYKEHPKIFSVDPMLAEAISQLNKLGYHTLASCEGHYEIKEYDVSYPKEKMFTGIYILFKENYKFLDIPEGFQKEDLEGRTYLFHPINYYDISKNHRNRMDFEIEKGKYCKIITEWAMNLPERER